jgi:GH15 family glucan-1,4-alpha-glucosidase
VTAVVPGDRLADRSVRVLRDGQARSGAYVASPNFDTYRYAWLRDGAFCAHAMDLAGERASSAAFHRWVAGSVEAHRGLIEAAIAGVEAGKRLPPEAFPPARYTLDGALEEPEAGEEWPNFQVDGYGMWLWALAEHLGGAAPEPDLARTVGLVARYLATTWRLRCYSCWEELDGGEHASTLGAVVAGLAAASTLLGDGAYAETADVVRASLTARFVVDGRFGRGPADPRLDGSLLWLAVPFGVLPAEHPLIGQTVAAARRDLAGPGGGIYRYLGDTYYGGGQWLLLTSSLAWHLARVGDREGAAAAQDWVRAQALANGDLPEQTTGHSQDPAMIEPWIERWGPVATPLLWSHAMYLIAEHELAR